MPQGYQCRQSREPRGLVEIAAVEQDYQEVITQVCPRWVTRRPFGYEDGHDFRVAHALKTVAVPQHLAEAQAELLFLVVVGDALDFGDEGGIACLPGRDPAKS
jgi:hypothetical protein